MKIIYKKCGNCDTWQHHILGHDNCLLCEGNSENIIEEIIKDGEEVSYEE